MQTKFGPSRNFGETSGLDKLQVRPVLKLNTDLSLCDALLYGWCPVICSALPTPFHVTDSNRIHPTVRLRVLLQALPAPVQSRQRIKAVILISANQKPLAPPRRDPLTMLARLTPLVFVLFAMLGFAAHSVVRGGAVCWLSMLMTWNMQPGCCHCSFQTYFLQRILPGPHRRCSSLHCILVIHADECVTRARDRVVASPLAAPRCATQHS